MPLFDVKAPNGKVYRVNAPRGASVDDAVAYVKAMLEPEQVSEEDIEPPKPEAGFFGALGESLADPVRFGAESAAFAANQTPETRAALLKAAESQYSPDAQFGEGANWEAFKNLAGRSAGQMLAPLAVGAATSVAATPVAGIAAGFATSAAQYENQNILDQAQRQQQAIDRGKAPEAFDLGRSLVASGLQAGLDVAQVGVISKILNKFPIAKGLVNGDRQATTLLTNALEQGNVTFTGKVMKGVAGNVAFEVPQEIGQQALTLWQSHQPLDDENAIKEYADAAVGAFVLGGTIGGVAGGAGYFTRDRGDKPLTPAETPDEAESTELPPELRGLSGSGIRGLQVALPEAQIPSLTPIDQGPPLTVNPFPSDESGGSGAPPPPPNEPPGGAPSGLAALIARQNNQGYSLSRLDQPSVSFPYTPGNLPGALPAGVNAAMPEGVNVGIDISTQLAKLAEAEAKRREAEAEARAAEAALRQGNANGNNAGSSQTAGNPPGGAAGAGTGVPPSTENPEGGGSDKPNSEGVDATGADAQGTLFGEPDGNAPLGGKPKILSGAEADAAALSVIEANDGVVDMAAIIQAVGSSPKAIAAVNRLKKKKVLASSVDDSHAEGTLATVARNNRIIDERAAPKSEAADAFEEGDVTELNDDFAPETETLDDGTVIDKSTGEVMGRNEGPAPKTETLEDLYFQTEQAPEAPAAGAPKLTGAAKFRADLESSISFLRSLGAETAPGQWKSFINNRLGLRLEDGYANSILDRMREQGIVRNKMGKLSFNEAPRGTSTNATPSTPPAAAAPPATPPAATPPAATPATPATPLAAAPAAAPAAPSGPPKVKVTTKIGVPKIPKAGKDVNGVKAIVDSVLAGWKNAPEVGVFQSLSDLPANIRSRVPSNAKGFLMGGKVFIIADNAKSDSGIRATLFHEALGHAGLRGKFGTELNKMLYDMHKTHKGIREAADAWMKRNPNSYTNLSKEDRISMAVEEIIAEHSEQGDTRTIWTSYGLNKIAALVRSFLRQLGIVRAYSTNDIANIVRQAHEHIIEGPGGPGGGVKTATTTGAPKTPAPIQFQRGEGKGKVSNEAMDQTNEAQRYGVGLPNGVVPEDMFKEEANPHITHGAGMYEYSLEHIGDLVHRLSHTDKRGGGVSYGISAGLEKSRRNYDLSSQHLERLLKSNYSYNAREKGYKGTYDQFVKEFEAAADRYADAYEQIPVHTELQRLARDAAVALGRRDFPTAKKNLATINERLNKDDAEAEYWKPSTIKEKYGPEPDIQFQRSDTNSNGIPIYHTKEGIDNFYKWFGDSKIVDADGNPIVLYHGMQDEMEGGAFRLSKFGTLGKGIYFTDDPVVAAQFANGSRGYREPEQKGNLVPAYLKMERPFDDAFLAEHPDWQKWVLENFVRRGTGNIESDKLHWTSFSGPWHITSYSRDFYVQLHDKLKRGEATVSDIVYMDPVERNQFPWVDELTKTVKEHGYFDGIVLKNPAITVNKAQKYGIPAFTEYVVFEPEQVKSAIGNNGQFSILSSDIQFQVDKKAIDSLGLPVHPTEAGQNNLLNKFGKVKPLIRDINGRVLRLYHGSLTSGIKALRSPIRRKKEDDRISTMLGTHLAPDPAISDRFAYDSADIDKLEKPTNANPFLAGNPIIEGGVLYPVYARGKMLDLRTNDRNGFDDAHVAREVISRSMTPEYVAKTIRINEGADVNADEIKYLMRWWKESAAKNTLYADPPDYVKQNVPIRYQYLTKTKFLDDMVTAYVQDGGRHLSNGETNEQETLEVVNDFILNSGYDGIIYTNTNDFETKNAANPDSYIIFHSNDMKSAMGNTGAFSEKDNMQFQREATSLFNSAAEAWNNIPTGNNKTIEEFLGFLEKFPGWLKRITFGMMSLSHIAETFKDHPMGVAVSRVENILNRRASKLDRRRDILVKNLERWNEIAITHKDKLNEFFDIANGTTVDQIEFLKKGANGKYVFDEDAPESDLKRRFLALPEPLQKTYMELRDSYGDMSEELINRISSAVSDDSIAKKLRNDYEKNRLQVYLPLFRSGSYWLSYFHNGENVTRSFENPRARRKAQQQMEEKGATEFASYERLNDRLNDRAQPPAGFVAEVITELRENGATQDMIDSVYETYMSYVPAQSIRQMFREREGVPGFEPDVFQAYANVATKMMNQLNNLEFTVSLDEATAEVNDAARLSSGASRTTATLGAAASNVVKQVEFIRNPTNSSAVDGASYWSYMWNIAGNVSSGIVNVTQLGLVVYPILGGKYGFGKTATAMDNATKMFFSGGRDTSGSTFLPDFTFYKDSLSQDYKDLFETAMDRAAIRSSSGQQLSEMRNNSTEDYTGLKAKVSHGLGFVFQNAERFNREVTLLAAYQLAKESGMGHDAAVNESIRIINEAHGTALPETGPRFFQKGLGKVAFTFKRFAQAQIYLLQKLFRVAFSNSDDVTRDMARRQLLGIYGMSYLFAGMQGMPLFGAAEVLANMLFGDEDEPFDLSEKVRESVGDLGYKGPINKLFNIDIAARTGFNGMVWRDDSKRAAEIGMTLYVAEHVFGPAYGIVRGVEQGAKQINQGDWYRGLESMTPSVIRNNMKGMRYAVDGATNKDGVPIVDDVNGYNAFMQIAGFTPADLSAARERAGAMKEAERKITQRRSSLLDRLDGALQNGDYSEAQDIRADINEFNKAHPQKGVKITSDTIKDSRKGKRDKENNAVDGVYLPDAMREELVEDYGN